MTSKNWLALVAVAALAVGCGPRPGTIRVNPDGGDASTMDDVTNPPGDGGPGEDGTNPGDVPNPPTDGGPLPNLTINRQRMMTSARFEFRDFSASSCDVVEGCITTPGRRRLLRFDLETPNNGTADVNIGNPRSGDPRFEYSTCHGHRHFLGYAEYAILDASGTQVARGHKQSFCLEDTRRTGTISDAPTSARYTCSGTQGIQRGWSDVYGSHLDCQYVDVTDLAPGTYRLRARVNVNRGIVESDYSDNEAVVDVTITPAGDAGMPDAGNPMDVLNPCPSGGGGGGPERNCGWRAEGSVRTCTPGAMVRVGCNGSCMPPLGMCTGDAMIRVCPGSAPCTNLTALSANDDACMTLCPQTQFTCPAGGMYNVLSASYDLAAHTCTVATSP